MIHLLSLVRPRPTSPVPVTSFVQDMGVDHGRADIVVPEQLLDGPYIGAGFKQVRGKRMAEGVTSCMLDNAGLPNGLLHGPLEYRLTGPVAALPAGLEILPPVLLGRPTAIANPLRRWDTYDPGPRVSAPVR